MAVDAAAGVAPPNGAVALKPPRLGISISFQAHGALGERSSTVYGEALELAAEADRLGIESIWTSEHHGEEDGYCPSPVLAGAALAVAAPRCRVGQAVALAPLQGHPLRLAEDLAVLDNLSGGRVEIGLGQGYRPAEFAMFGLPYARRTAAFEDALDILRLAWRGGRFDYAGRVHSVTGGVLRPPPVRPGAPPLWIGAAAPASRARAVRHRAGLVVAPLTELEHTARQFASFDGEAAAQGAGALPRALMREILVGGSAADAIDRHARYLDHVYRVQYAPERTGLTVRDPATGARRPLTSEDPHYLSEAFMRERWFVGAPEEIAGQIAAWQRRMRLEHLIFHPRQPGMPLREAVECVAAVAGGVMPRVRTLLAAD